MAKTNSDTTPPESLAAPSTMAILKNASASAKPPTMQGKSGGPLPQNTKP